MKFENTNANRKRGCAGFELLDQPFKRPMISNKHRPTAVLAEKRRIIPIISRDREISADRLDRPTMGPSLVSRRRRHQHGDSSVAERSFRRRGSGDRLPLIERLARLR
jgi:hypothetical protein